MDRLQTPSIVTSDFVYLRLIGDRRLAESQFGKFDLTVPTEYAIISDDSRLIYLILTISIYFHSLIQYYNLIRTMFLQFQPQ